MANLIRLSMTLGMLCLGANLINVAKATVAGMNATAAAQCVAINQVSPGTCQMPR